MTTPSIGLALGGGAARGLAHVVVLEALDELGIRPSIIAGASMGALVGASYASGIPAREIREHAVSVLGNRRRAARHMFAGGESNPLSLLNFSLSRPVLIDGPKLVNLVLPDGVASRIEETTIPFMVNATDFYGASEMVIREGDLRTAVAASIAIPGLIAAPPLHGKLVIDGAISNPVPFEHVNNSGCDIVIAVDVTGKPVPSSRRKRPGLTDLAFGATQIMQRQITRLMRESSPPDIYIKPAIDHFKAYDFFKIKDILAAAEPAREELKRQLGERLQKG